MAIWRFNTQPPEGGWFGFPHTNIHARGFNTQPPEGGWIYAKVPLLY